MNYREKIRENIKHPLMGEMAYGKWSNLKIEQRILIKRLLDEMDSADEYIKYLYKKNKELQNQIKELEEDRDMYQSIVESWE